MHILHLLIVISFHFVSIRPSSAASDTKISADELNSLSTDAAFDTQVSENGPTLPPSDQPLDESSGTSNPIPGSDSINSLDGNTVADVGDVALDLNTDVSHEILADNLCPSPGSRPNRKLRSRGHGLCSAPLRLHTGATDDPDAESNGEETPVPDMSMSKFNARPLGRGETEDDMCKRFLGGLLPNAVCSSGSKEDETYSLYIYPPIPFVTTSLKHCTRGMSIDLFFTLCMEKSYAIWVSDDFELFIQSHVL